MYQHSTKNSYSGGCCAHTARVKDLHTRFPNSPRTIPDIGQNFAESENLPRPLNFMAAGLGLESSEAGSPDFSATSYIWPCWSATSHIFHSHRLSLSESSRSEIEVRCGQAASVSAVSAESRLLELLSTRVENKRRKRVAAAHDWTRLRLPCRRARGSDSHRRFLNSYQNFHLIK